MAIIFILSGSYCHGDDVVSQISSQLDYNRIEDEVLAVTSARYHVSRDRLVRALNGPVSFINTLTHEREKNIAYIRTVLAELILQDNVLLHGCMGHLVPRTIGHALHVCLIANLNYRIRQAQQEHGISEKEARKQILKNDKSNNECTTYFFDKPAYDASLYDIVIPMHDTTVEKATGIIYEHVKNPAVQTTEQTVQAVKDFILAATVELKLVEAGYQVAVHAEQGNVVLLMNEYVVRQKHYEQQLRKIASEIEGISEITIRFGPKYAPPSLNPWSKLDPSPRYLLVDDEKEFVHTLSERLQTRDLNSAIAYDGEQALDMLEKEPPDVIVLDLMMPGIDGIEVLRRVKESHPEVEVIILTGHGSEREKELAEELGAFAYLQKPANIDDLARVMKEAYNNVNRRRGHDT